MPVASKTRAHLYTMRFNDAEDAAAKRVAEALGLPLSSAVRMLILDKARELGVDATKPLKTTRAPSSKKGARR